MHKFVLAAHSDVFRAMFQHKNSVENIQSRVKITDFDSTVVNQILKYLYFGELPDKLANENLSELLRIAEKYHLELLKLDIEEKMIRRYNLKYGEYKLYFRYLKLN